MQQEDHNEITIRWTSQSDITGMAFDCSPRCGQDMSGICQAPLRSETLQLLYSYLKVKSSSDMVKRTMESYMLRIRVKANPIAVKLIKI